MLVNKEVFHDVPARIKAPGLAYPALLAWAEELDSLQPWRESFIAGHTLSRLFAANAADGAAAVSFCVGSQVTKDDKVFAASEVSRPARNPNVDAITRDLVAYFQRCVQSGQANINTGFIAG